MSGEKKRHQWLILQDGNLPLCPDGQLTATEHVCTATLVWPDGEPLTQENSVVIDPCFSSTGWQTALQRLASIGATPADIGFFFEGHQHADHRLQIPQANSFLQWRRSNRVNWQRLDARSTGLPDIASVACPGHEVDLHALQFQNHSGQVWIASDAVLNRDWLVTWGYYWPNIYSGQEIVATWKSVAKIVVAADTIIPGHGPPIYVDAELLTELIKRFPGAEYANRCPIVPRMLKRRLAQLRCI